MGRVSPYPVQHDPTIEVLSFHDPGGRQCHCDGSGLTFDMGMCNHRRPAAFIDHSPSVLRKIGAYWCCSHGSSIPKGTFPVEHSACGLLPASTLPYLI